MSGEVGIIGITLHSSGGKTEDKRQGNGAAIKKRRELGVCLKRVHGTICTVESKGCVKEGEDNKQAPPLLSGAFSQSQFALAER